MTRSICTFPDCGRDMHAKGLCKAHYVQRRLGNQLTPLRPPNGTIPLAERFWSKVQRGDGCWPWIAVRGTDGYGQFWLDGRMYSAHRLAYELTSGSIPEGMELDHTCHSRSCVNPSHLRAVTTKQNQEHRSGPQRDNSTGVLGVTRDKRDGRYRARVKHNGQELNAGTFTTLEEAGEAAKQLRLRLFTHNDADRKAS